MEPSFIRIESDEATYNMHIMLRMEIEIALMEDEVKVKDLPEFWNQRFTEYLGITPANDAEGVLQDVHWSFGLFGYFATYALGNLISQQLWDVMLKDHPDVDEQMSKGDFSAIFNWMSDKVYRHGSKFEPKELVQRITGSGIDGEPYIRYLNKKIRRDLQSVDRKKPVKTDKMPLTNIDQGHFSYKSMEIIISSDDATGCLKLISLRDFSSQGAV